VNNGGKSWYFLTADYTFGTTLENIASEVVKENGGTVLGSARAPLNTMDFSSFILQAQNSNAQVLGLANGGGDTVNAITAASQFGLTRQMSLAGLLIHISDIHSLGLDVAQGMYATIGWYWDQDEASRKWSKRFFERMKVAPTAAHAGSYSAAMHYLNAVKALGTDDPDQVMAHMKSTPINDMFTRNGNIRPDGRMVYDMYLMQVKSPDESRYPWDYFKKIDRISGASIYTTKEESKCALWK